MNKLLKRQIMKFSEEADRVPGKLEPLFKAISDAYDGFDSDRKLIEHSFDLNSMEFADINKELQAEITERTKAEERLKASEKRARAWLEHSPMCTKIVDLDFNLQYMSAAGTKGLNIDDITQYYGKPYPFHFYPESFRNLMTNNLKKVKETGEIITQEGSVNDIDGNELWFHSTLVPVNDDEGRIEYIIVTSIEITDRKQAEEIIKNQVGRLSALRSIDKAITASLDLDLTLDVLLTNVKSELKIDAASVLLFNQDSQLLEYTVSTGFQTNALKYTRLKMGESYAGQAAMKREIINIPNLNDESTGFERSQLFSNEGFISYFAIPLIAKGLVLGVIEIFHRSQLNVEPEWVEFIESIATQGAML